MKRVFLGFLLILLFGVSVTALPVSPLCNAADPHCDANFVDGCDVVANTSPNPGNYFFPLGIDVCSDNVVLNLTGVKLDGNAFGSGIGIDINGYDSVTILDGNIGRYQTGISLANTTGVTIDCQGGEIRWPSHNFLVPATGIKDENSSNLSISRCTLSNFDTHILAQKTNSLTINDNYFKTIHGYGTATRLLNVDTFVIRDNNFGGTHVDQLTIADVNSRNGDIHNNDMGQNYFVSIRSSDVDFYSNEMDYFYGYIRLDFANNFTFSDTNFVNFYIEQSNNLTFDNFGGNFWAYDSNGLDFSSSRIGLYGENIHSVNFTLSDIAGLSAIGDSRDVTVSNSTFGWGDYNAYVDITGPGVRIENNTFRNFSTLHFLDSNNLVFSNNTGEKIFAYGQNSSGYIVTNNSFNDAELQLPAVIFTSNTLIPSPQYPYGRGFGGAGSLNGGALVANNTGNWTLSAGGATVQGNSLDGYYAQIFVASNTLVSNNSVSGNILYTGSGIYTDGSNITIVDNDFLNGGAGATLQMNGNTNVVIERNTINGNQRGVVVYDLQNPSDVSIKNNIISNNAEFNVTSSGYYLTDPTTLDVSENYFDMTNAYGNQDCQGIDDTIVDLEEGSWPVNFNPVLSAPYPGGVAEDKCTPILLVHGIYSDDSIWGQGLESELDQLGMRVFKVGNEINQPGLVPNNGSIEGSAFQVKLAMDSMFSKTGEKADIVGHSMGGLAARYYAQSPQVQGKIRKLIMLGTPNEGAPIANNFLAKLMGLIVGGDPQDTARYQMIPGSTFLTKLNSLPPNPEVEYIALAGDKLTDNLLLRLGICAVQPSYCFSGTPTDSIVPVSHVNTSLGACYQPNVTHASTLGPSYYSDAGVVSDIISLLRDQGSTYQACTQPFAAFLESTQVREMTNTIGANQTQVPFTSLSSRTHINAVLASPDSNVGVNLVTPLGQDINAETYQGFPNVTYETGFFDGNKMEWISVENPTAGNWSVKVKAGALQGRTKYYLTTFENLPVKLDVSTDNTTYLPQSSAVIRAEIKNGARPILGVAVQAAVVKPDHSSSSLSLFDDGLHSDGGANDGLYANNYSIGTLLGDYSYTVDANGALAALPFHITSTSAFIVEQTTDVFLSPARIKITPEYPDVSTPITIDMNVANIGMGPATNARIDLYSDDPLFGGTLIDSEVVTIPPGQNRHVQFSWTSPPEDTHYLLHIMPSYFNSYTDTNVNNQLAVIPLDACVRDYFPNGQPYRYCLNG